MSRVWAIATNTFREAVRDRVLHSILFFAALLVALSMATRELTIGDGEKVVRGVALGGISLVAAVIAIFLGVGLVYKEIERKTIYTLAARPVPRWQLLLGKYLGLWLTLAVEVGALLGMYVVMVTVEQGFPAPMIFVSVGMLMVELTLLTAFATLFSTFASPMMASAYTLCVYVVGHFCDDLQLFGEKSEDPAFRTLATTLYRVLPDLDRFNLRTEAVHGIDVPAAELVHSTVYGLAYTAAVLAVAMMVFQKRDFK